MAYKLYKMARNASHTSIKNFKIDGTERKLSRGWSMWTIMCGNVHESETPNVTLEFDFEWHQTARLEWAATVVQARFKSYLVRKKLNRALKRSFHAAM